MAEVRPTEVGDQAGPYTSSSTDHPDGAHQGSHVRCKGSKEQGMTSVGLDCDARTRDHGQHSNED